MRLALGTVALCALVALPFAARFADLSPGLRAPHRSSDAASLIRRQQFEAAHEILARQARSGSRDTLLQFRLAICERALGMADSAYARLLRLEGALPLLEDHRRLWIARSLEQLAATGPDSAAALSSYRDLLALSPHEAVADSAHRYLAAALRDARLWEEALAVYEEQRATGGPDATLLYRIAEAQERSGKQSRARRTRLELIRSYPAHRMALDASRQLAPRTTEERYARAQVFYRHRDDRRAIEDLRRLLRSSPTRELQARAEYVLGRAYARSGQLARARHTFERLHETHGWPSALYRLAGLEVSSNRDLDAVDTYLEFVEHYPAHDLADDALWQAAKAAERHDEFALAGRVYRQLATDYGASDYAEDAAWGEGFSLYCLGDFDGALDIFRHVARQARQPHMVDQGLYWAAKAAQRLGNDDESRTLFARAAEGFPRSYYSSRAVALGFGGQHLPPRTPSLRSPLDISALDLRRLRGSDHVRRAFLFGDLGLAGQAEGELRLAERANRGNADALLVLRDGYDMLGLHDRALVLSTRARHADRDLDRLYPNYYWEEIAEASRDAQVDPYLVLSVIRQESYFNEDAVSHAGAVGLMQIMPQTGRRLARSAGVAFERRLLFDPEVSIQFGSRFLADQVRSFGPDTGGLQFPLGLAAYNAGPRVARRWLERFPNEDDDVFVERIPYKETRLYVKKVLKNYAIYKQLSGERDA